MASGQEHAAMPDRSPKEQKPNVPTIRDVEVIHPRRALLQIAWPRKTARGNLVASLMCLVFVWALIIGLVWYSGRDPSPGTRAGQVALYLVGSYCVLVSLPGLVRYARIATKGDVLTFSREAGTIERNGKLLARFDDVSHVEVRSTTRMTWGSNDIASTVVVNQLSVILKKYKRVRICDVREGAEGKAEQIELAKELGQMLGVRVTFPQYVE
jgi:hypothetical protein